MRAFAWKLKKSWRGAAVISIAVSARGRTRKEVGQRLQAAILAQAPARHPWRCAIE